MEECHGSFELDASGNASARGACRSGAASSLMSEHLPELDTASRFDKMSANTTTDDDQLGGLERDAHPAATRVAGIVARWDALTANPSSNASTAIHDRMAVCAAHRARAHNSSASLLLFLKVGKTATTTISNIMLDSATSTSDYNSLGSSVCSASGDDCRGAFDSAGSTGVATLCERLSRSGAVPTSVDLYAPFAFDAPSCNYLGNVTPPLRLMTMLRDPVARSRSLWDFAVSACVCPPGALAGFCTGLGHFATSIFAASRLQLCPAGRGPPRLSFYDAVLALGEHLRAENTSGHSCPHPQRFMSARLCDSWPSIFAPGASPSRGLLQLTATTVTNRYVEAFGYDWRAQPDGGASLGSFSTALAVQTLSNCFSFVGVTEHMDVSLRLLRVELPAFFGQLNVSDALSVRLNPSPYNSEAATHGTTKERSLPLLRNELLREDELIYRSELNRFVARAADIHFHVLLPPAPPLPAGTARVPPSPAANVSIEEANPLRVPSTSDWIVLMASVGFLVALHWVVRRRSRGACTKFKWPVRERAVQCALEEQEQEWHVSDRPNR